MDTIIVILTGLFLLLGVGTMIYFGIKKTIDGSYVSRAFIGDDDEEFDDDKK